MTLEVFAFFAIAASLVLVGFASGPVITRRSAPRIRRGMFDR